MNFDVSPYDVKHVSNYSTQSKHSMMLLLNFYYEFRDVYKGNKD